MNFEENILRVLTVEEVAYMPELSEFNPVGITEKDAREIGKRNNLRVGARLKNPVYFDGEKFKPTEKIFHFRHRDAM